jgi:hypothetical protein
MSELSNNDLALQVAALKVLSDYTMEHYLKARAEANRVMKRGERLVARSPIDDTKIAVIPKSEPKRITNVVDEPALIAWMAEHYPEHIVGGTEVIGSQPEVIRVLFEHAPHLLKRVKRVSGEVLSDIKQASSALGQPIGPGAEVDIPGLEVREPDPVVSCRPTDEALAIIKHLHAEGVLQLDGTVAAVRQVAS